MITTLLLSLIALISIAGFIIVLNKLSIISNLKNELKDEMKIQDDLQKLQEKFESKLSEESKSNRELDSMNHKNNREEMAGSIKFLREELTTAFNTLKQENQNQQKTANEAIASYIRDLSKLQTEQLQAFATQLKNMSDGSRQDLTQMRTTMENNIKQLQEENAKKLEEMRVTVDEKLQSTLEKRLDISFKQVSERLEQVHKGLGEMQTLATGVGDLKKVLTNVKTRGTWGEIQLNNLLAEVLTPDQFQENVQTKPKSQERVDFAIKLPGDKNSDEPVWLPIDSKFPQEDYQRLVEAQESADPELAEAAMKQLENRIKLEAKSIKEKYIQPPYTTDFAILFLPTESLYAEVIRRQGLFERLQRDYRVNVVGPTTLAALLNSLQMGFRTLTIQKRSSEVWKYLADVRKHFGTFGDLLLKAHTKVEQATKHIEDAGKRSRTIETKLRKVEEINLDADDISSQALLSSAEAN